MNTEKRDATALSQHIWALKDANKTFEITWEVLKQAKPYKCGTRSCDLCTEEKLHILQADPTTRLNNRSEIVKVQTAG